MMTIESFDNFLSDSGPAALVLREELEPVEGPGGVIFPPTFAKGDAFPGGYNIDEHPDGGNVCLVDSVGSQANRIEPIFSRSPYAILAPQISIVAGERMLSIFAAGHRAGDAILRCSKLKDALQAAFKALQKGDAAPLAKLAPTSLIFGVWDSRDTQAKAPRIVSSTIRAYNVRRLTRSAQYVPATDYVGESLLDVPGDKATKDAYAERGFVHVPASASPGGVIAHGGIRRDAILSLAALHLLTAGTDENATKKLRRYLLGLSLTAFTANVSGYLRQGCSLVLDATKPEPRRIDEVYPSGERRAFTMSHAGALDYAKAVAIEFGVGQATTVHFDRELAKRDLAGDGEKKGKGKKAKG